MSRRRALMPGDHWEQVAFPITNFSNNHQDTYSEFGPSSVRVYNTIAYAYRNIWANFATSADYEYRYTVDVTVTAGTGKIGCRAPGGSMITPTASEALAPGSYHIDIVFAHNATIDKITMFCTWTTAALGNVTFSNFELYRRRVA